MSSSSDVLGGERPITLNHFSAKHIVEKQSIPYDPQFEVNFTEDDPHSARCLPVWRKWVIVVVVSTTNLCFACASSLYTGTTAQVEDKFGTSRTITTLGLSMFVVGLGLGPMILAPLSEFYGRRPVYVISTLMFVIWIVPCAVANNIATLVIARFLDGFAGAAFLSVAGGTVGDMFTGAELQKPMMVYTAAPFLGPELGPLIADFINYKANWRWTFWVLLIWAGIQWLLIVCLVPETYVPVLLRREAVKARTETGDDRWHAPIERLERSIPGTILKSCHRPFLLMIYEPMVLLLCLFCAVILGILYLFFSAFDIVFEHNQGFKLWQVGLSFLGIMVGMIIGILSGPLWHKNYLRLVRHHEEMTGEVGGSEPEYRLPSAIVGAPLIVVGMLCVILIFSGIFTFLVDSFPNYAASALAANSFARSMFAAMFPLFGPAMYNNLGYQWVIFLLTMLAAILAPCPYIFYRYGKQIKKRSREIERLKAYIRDLEADASDKELASGLQEAPSTSSVPTVDSSQCTGSQTSAARAATWVVDEGTGCPRYCNYSSSASVIHRCYKYLSSALGEPALHDPFSLGSAASTIGIANEGAYSDLISMTRLQEEHYLNLFWQSYHILLPVLHFEAFTRDYNSLWTLDDSVRGDSALVDVVLALCAQYGSCFMSSDGKSGGSQAQHSVHVSQFLFDRARQLMSTRTEWLSIHTVQCHLLSAVYLANNSLTNAAHDSLAQALRNALALGLHHGAPPTMPEQEKVLRQNIWWSIYTMDVRISLDLGQPFLVNHRGATCSIPHTVEESETSLPADNLSTTFRGLPSIAYFNKHLSLTIAVRKTHEAFVTHCAAALEAANTSDFYESAHVIKDSAEYLLECLKPVHDWTKQVPDLLKTPRRGAGRPFSTVRSPLDIEEPIPSWLQRQRILLELSNHNFLMILHRPFIRFPSSSVGRIPVSAEHSVWSLNHAIITTQIIRQVSTESDVLSFVHETTRLLWDATVTLLAFAMAHPFCPHSPSAHAALQNALATFDVLAECNSHPAYRAAETTRKILAHMDSVVSGFQTGSLSTSSNATLRFVNGSNGQRHKSLDLSSGAANHDEDCAFTMPSTYTSTMDLDALNLFSGLDEVFSDQTVDPSAMSLLPLIDEPHTVDGQLLGVFD
ncbi:MFS general substrate transporter, partial [Aureobasidium melanogenum]